MSTTSDRRQQLIESFQDKEYRDAFVASHITKGVALAFRETRRKQELSQEALAEKAQTKQKVISNLESLNYGNFSVNSLKRVASALDIALLVTPVSFGQFVDWIVNLSPESFAIPSFDQDKGLALEHQHSSPFNTATASIGIGDPYGAPFFFDAVMVDMGSSGQKPKIENPYLSGSAVSGVIFAEPPNEKQQLREPSYALQVA